MLQWMDDHFGMIETINDRSYVMDDFGNAIEVPWHLFDGYWQDADLRGGSNAH